MSLRKVALEPCLLALGQEGRLAGLGSVDMDLTTAGTTVAAYVAGLTGSMKAQVQNGSIKGINVAQTLREVSNAVKNVRRGQTSDLATKFDRSRQTDFTSPSLAEVGRESCRERVGQDVCVLVVALTIKQHPTI